MITHIIITLAAVFITTYLSHRYAIIREDKSWNRTLEIIKLQEFNKASSIFRAVFVKEIRVLGNSGVDTSYILANAIGKHERGMIIFRPNLPVDVLKGFDTAWREYACPHKTNPDYVDMEQYFSNETTEKERFRKLAVQRIEKLLEYAKPR